MGGAQQLMRRATVLLLAVWALALGAATAYAAFTATTSNSGNSFAAASSFTSCDYPSTVQGTSGLVSYWRLGETSGTTAADSQGSNTGTYTNGVTLGATGAIAGDSNKGASFDGVNDYVNVPDSSSLRPATQISLEAWVKPNASVPNYASVATKTTLNTWSDGYGMYAWQGGIDFWVNDDSHDVFTTAISTSTWTHIVGTYDGSTVKIYANGVLAQSFSYSAPLIHLVTPLKIGDASGTSNYHWPGGIDDVAIYNTALSATTVQNHFRCGQRYRDVVLDTPGLQSYWRLGEPGGAVAFDSKGTSNGTYENGVTLGSAGALTAAGDTSASLDGSNDRVSVPDATSLKPSSISVEAWAKPSAGIQNYASIATKTTVDSWSDGYGMYYWGGNVYFWVNDDPNDVAATSVPTGSWTHLVGTYDGSTIRIYKNGTLAQSFAYSASITHSTQPLLIGDAAGTGNYHWLGNLDEVAVYNRALTAAEAKQHYEAR
jgi:hypothetical protein